MMFVYVLASYVIVAMAMDTDTSESLPVPQFCFLRPQGGGRATHPRFWYNADADECQMFRWRGGVSEGNVFLDKSECEQTCKRDDTEALGRTCDLAAITGPDQITLCLDQDATNMTRDQCNMLGCCWNLGICFQHRGSLFRASCSIRRNTPTDFWGKVVFQTDVSAPEWVGSIMFNQPVVGDFCIIRKSPNYVDLSNSTLSDRQQFLLPNRRGVVAGERITIMFKGRFDSTPLNAGSCSAVNRRN